jgi:carbon storage regulator
VSGKKPSDSVNGVKAKLLADQETRKRGLLQGGPFVLVLSRKRGERIVVPQCRVTITVCGIRGNTVRLAIAAPEEIDIYREEVWRDQQGQRLAAKRSRGLRPAPTTTEGVSR